MIKKEKRRLCAIILAAGSSRRMGDSLTKQRMSVSGESILSRSVRAFSECNIIDSVVVVSRADEIGWASEELKGFSKVCAIIPGGKTRAESARIGFEAIPEDTNFVAIHDAARCLVTKDNIMAVAEMAFIHGAATACNSVTDTVKAVGSNGLVNETLPRNNLLLAQTPQIFERSLYEEALLSFDNDESITDDNMMIERLGRSICPVDTGKQNIKITTAEDIAYAEFIIERRGGISEMRIGHGYDVHRFAEGRKLILGGVDIPFEKGLLGHSDADVLVHAIMDALLGAVALGDIGTHFPDSDDRYKGISSLELLKSVHDLIKNNNYSIVNIDATLVIQRPKIAPYVNEMVNNISHILEIDRGRINIKATTEEHLGFTGREEGVSAHAVALLTERK